MGSKMKPPRWVQKNLDCEGSIKKENIKSYDGTEISVVVIDPYGLEEVSPCLVYFRGGGFFFKGAGYHYKLAKQYALECECRVIFVQYRLSPKNPHPTPAEDCYAALRWTFENAERLKIDQEKIAVGGDSAGGALAVAGPFGKRGKYMKHIETHGVRLSRFQLGTVQLGMTYGLGEDKGKPSLEKAMGILDAAVVHGINVLDTANTYGDSEAVIGKWLAKRRVPLFCHLRLLAQRLWKNRRFGL